jgi:hypothetical protein
LVEQAALVKGSYSVVVEVDTETVELEVVTVTAPAVEEEDIVIMMALHEELQLERLISIVAVVLVKEAGTAAEHMIAIVHQGMAMTQPMIVDLLPEMTHVLRQINMKMNQLHMFLTFQKHQLQKQRVLPRLLEQLQQEVN